VSCDIDAEALDVCRENLSDFSADVELPVDIVNCDVTLPYLYSRWKGIIDTVIMNPPFGTKNNEGMFNHLIFVISALIMKPAFILFLVHVCFNDYLISL
jgi:predicted RNA methylase